MHKEYCRDCGAEIVNVEEWLLKATSGMWKCRNCHFDLKSDNQPAKPSEDTSRLVWPNDGRTQCDSCQMPVDAPERKDRPSYCGLPHYGECAFFVPKAKVAV